MFGSGLCKRVAVVSDDAVERALLGFGILRCTWGQADSLKVGVRAAIALGADQIVVCLADMPFVTAQHIDDLLAHAKIHPTCASKYGRIVSPPAVLAKVRFDDLLALDGDRGAFSLFKGQPDSVFLNVKEPALADLDTMADFRTYANE